MAEASLCSVHTLCPGLAQDGQEVGQIEHQGKLLKGECRGAGNVSQPLLPLAWLPRMGSTAISSAEMSDLESPRRRSPEVGRELS